MRKIIGVIFPIISIALLLWTEQCLTIAYGWKTACKIILFFVMPLLLFRTMRFPFVRHRQVSRQQFFFPILLGFILILLILGTFILIRPYLDIEQIIRSLYSISITKTTFPFIAIYIVIGNSFVEEFFFRGTLPMLFGTSPLRFVLPPFFFAIYHVTIFLQWFSLPLLLLAVIGLWIGGLLFQVLNNKSGTIYPGWIVHIFADVSIIWIGIYILYFY